MWLSSWEVAWLPGSQVSQEEGPAEHGRTCPSGSQAILTPEGPARFRKGPRGQRRASRWIGARDGGSSGTLASGLMARLALCPPVRAATGS